MEAKFQCFSFQMAGDRELPGLAGEEGRFGGGVTCTDRQTSEGWGLGFLLPRVVTSERQRRRGEGSAI